MGGEDDGGRAQPRHIIVPRQGTVCRVRAEILGLPTPVPFLHFLVVDLANGASIDFMEKTGAISTQHYAFLIDDAGFDAVLGRIRDKGVAHWADPGRSQPGEINHYGGGRGVYFADPNGHLLEAITKPYPR